ncbi:glycogen operon protein GlgX homolog [Arthrobacter sp. Hiyo8]|nr:glycogen operon protein GlgX homolog [Arthrobacter sp. Hiyo8]
MMMGVVINPFFDWDGDHLPRIPYHRSVIYEAHVKGLTQLHPEVPEEQRGTYAGVAHPAVISHLQKLGVTAIELMPVHQFTNDGILQDKGLNNYWGYNTIGFFAPHNSYSSKGDTGQQVQDFKAMVRSSTGPASRSFSTSCTTTQPKATTSAPRCLSRASTTPRTTV